MPVLDPLYPEVNLAADSADTFRFELETADAGLVSTARFRFVSPHSSGTGDGTESFTVTHVIGGNIRSTVGRDDIDVTRPFITPARQMHSSWDEMTVGSINLDLSELRRFAQTLAGDADFRLAFTGVSPVDARLAQFWTSTVRHLNRNLMSDDLAMASPLVRRAAFEQLALAVLTVFPNTLMDRRAPKDIGAAASAALRRAVAYIDDHLADEVTVPDIAAASRLSIRGLTAAFRRELDTTPTAYLRTARLDAAHQNLLAADPVAGDTVAAIATRWGFRNQGRFATSYRSQFGASPADTLRS